LVAGIADDLADFTSGRLTASCRLVQMKRQGGKQMRKTIVAAMFGVLVAGASAAAAHAASCSDPYRVCLRKCAKVPGSCAAGLCEGFKASCMQTGTWQSPNYRKEGLAKR
jgi:hypothetical protein